jgi:hypothetical protein
VLALAGEEAQRLGETAISPRHLLVAILREGQGIAAQLLLVSGVNLEPTGDTARIGLVPDESGSITLPPDFQEALLHHPVAYRLFEKLPYTKQKKFVGHIEQAAGEAARSQQIANTIEQLHMIYQIHQRLQ